MLLLGFVLAQRGSREEHRGNLLSAHGPRGPGPGAGCRARACGRQPVAAPRRSASWPGAAAHLVRAAGCDKFRHQPHYGEAGAARAPARAASALDSCVERAAGSTRAGPNPRSRGRKRPISALRRLVAEFGTKSGRRVGPRRARSRSAAPPHRQLQSRRRSRRGLIDGWATSRPSRSCSPARPILTGRVPGRALRVAPERFDRAVCQRIVEVRDDCAAAGGVDQRRTPSS